MSHLPPAFPSLVFVLLASGSDAEAGNSLSLDQFRFFDATIAPALAMNCHRFQSIEKGTTQGFPPLDPHDGLLQGGAAAVSFQPDEIRLMQAIRHHDPDFAMPPGKKGGNAASGFNIGRMMTRAYQLKAEPAAFNPDNSARVRATRLVSGLSAPGTSVGPGGAAIVPAQSPPEVASPPAAGEPVEHLTLIVEISGARVTFLSNSAEAGAAGVSGGGRGNMRRGRSGGGAAAGNGALLTLPVTENTLITTVVSARRTGDLLIGEELPGGLTNGHFENMGPQGLRARLVVQGGTISEINVFISQEEATPPIAIKPKRPPVR